MVGRVFLALLKQALANGVDQLGDVGFGRLDQLLQATLAFVDLTIGCHHVGHIGQLGFEVVAVPVAQKITAIAELRLNQLSDRAVLDENRIEQQQRLDKHLQAGRVRLVEREIAVLLRVGCGGEDVFQLHPLRRETVKEALNLRIGQHAVNGLGDYLGLGQFALAGQFEQFCIRTAGPEEKRQARSQGILAELGVGGVVVEQEHRRRKRGRGDLFHHGRVGHLLFQFGEGVGGVTVDGGFLHGPAEGALQKVGNTLARLSRHISIRGGCLEKGVPNADGVFVEVRAFHDRHAEAQEGIEEQRRKRQLIGLIIEPVRGAEILRERSHLAQPGGGIERERTDIHTIGHLGGVEVNGLARHQLFRQRKHIAV